MGFVRGHEASMRRSIAQTPWTRVFATYSKNLNVVRSQVISVERYPGPRFEITFVSTRAIR